MRHLLLFLICTFLGSSTALASEAERMTLHAAPRALPDITFADETGMSLHLRDWRGRFVLLNMWATWCGPCRVEMPALDRLQAQLGNERFEVLALSIDRAGPPVVRSFYDDIGIKHLRIFIDRTMRAARDLGVSGLPTTILIGPDGRELARHLGPVEWDQPGMVAFLRSAIATHFKED